MEFNFKGQIAVVTGGPRGIGRGITEALLKAGAKVIATYQSNDKAAKEFAESNKKYSDYLDLRSFNVTQLDGGNVTVSWVKYIPEPSHHHEFLMCRGSNDELMSGQSKTVQDHHQLEIVCK